MKTIYKYNLEPFGDIIEIEMPKNAKILSVGSQDTADLVCWAEIDTREHLQARKFRIVETGHDLSNDDMARLEFISTVQTLSGSVWHVYEQVF